MKAFSTTSTSTAKTIGWQRARLLPLRVPGRALMLAFLYAVLATPACFADDAIPNNEQPSTPAQIKKLVQKLGATNYTTRERAMQSLAVLGADAETALIEASKSKDREVRIRSLKILGLINEQRREAELTEFREGAMPEAKELALPGWKLFTERYGNTEASRTIYAQMLEHEWQMLDEYFATRSDEPNARSRAVTTQRYIELQRSPIGYLNYPVGTLLTFFVVASDNPNNFDQHSGMYSFMRHRALSPYLATITDGVELKTEPQIVRKIVGDWIVSASGKHFNDRRALQTTVQYRMKREGQIISKKVLVSKEAMPLSKSMAMQSIALRNDKTQIELIEPFLQDQTPLGKHGTRERQMRDVALACLMQLQGFDATRIGARPTPTSTHSAFEYKSLGFISDLDRKRALKLYEELLAEKKKTSK